MKKRETSLLRRKEENCTNRITANSSAVPSIGNSPIIPTHALGSLINNSDIDNSNIDNSKKKKYFHKDFIDEVINKILERFSHPISEGGAIGKFFFTDPVSIIEEISQLLNDYDVSIGKTISEHNLIIFFDREIKEKFLDLEKIK